MINYYLLTKPGILMGNLFTLAAGFILGSQGSIDIGLFLATFVGLGLVMASGCVFNNYIDRSIDKKMERTKKRALVEGAISGPNALLYASVLGILGAATLYAFTNMLALGLAAFGFFIYVVIYSYWKCHTVYGTAIGSLAGAVPPVVGYVAASAQFDSAAIILFLMMVLWQMPHFFSIALNHLEDYRRGGIPVLPLSRGIFQTKVHTVLYIVAFIPTTMLLTYFGYTGNQFLWVVGCGGLLWLGLALQGFWIENDKKWGRQMFVLSLAVIGSICVSIFSQ